MGGPAGELGLEARKEDWPEGRRAAGEQNLESVRSSEKLVVPSTNDREISHKRAVNGLHKRRL